MDNPLPKPERGSKAQPPAPGLYSIGHSNHPIDRFLSILRGAGIQVVADVRSQPYSRNSAQFDKDVLTQALKHAGVDYIFLGPELGGRPADPHFYDAAGHVLYDRLAASPPFQAGIERLTHESAHRGVAMLCSEERPLECHRYLLVTRVLESRGLPVLHIRADGRVQTGMELEQERRASQKDSDQLSLFKSHEDPPWRSLRSVLRADQQPISSKPFDEPA